MSFPSLPRGLVVSCQAEGDSPFNAPVFVAAFARAAEEGGAVAVRICGIENIRAVRRAVRLPIVGLTKSTYDDGSVLITPGMEDVSEIEAAGADIVAMDATDRQRPAGGTGTETLAGSVAAARLPIMADVSTFEEGMAAARAGAALVGTTLAGYTPATRAVAGIGPDLDLVSRLVSAMGTPVVAEGRFWTPEEAAEALRLGAHAVVVGTAITRPIEIVKRFVSATSAVPRPAAGTR